VDPYGFGVVEGGLYLKNLLGNLLINSKIVLPVLEVVIAHVSDVLEVVEERTQNVLIVEQTWFKILN